VNKISNRFYTFTLKLYKKYDNFNRKHKIIPMNLPSPQKDIYAKERFTASEAQRLAQEITFGPVVFQVSRLMVKFGIFKLLLDEKDGLTLEAIAEKTGLSRYAVQVLLESSLTVGTVLLRDNHFLIAKAGYFLLNDRIARVNMDFIQDVNYLGMSRLEESLLNGKPEGLKVFGDWPTIYEGLSSLPEQVQKSWFGFDQFYSDHSFDEALEIVFRNNPGKLLDVGGNTGRWATKCVNYSADVHVTVMDLPQQIALMKASIKDLPAGDRIHGYETDLLNKENSFPSGFDAIWMSQFLDCFSEEEVISILSRAARSMSNSAKLYIMETFWDRQHFEAASYCLTQISLYFTALANGNSKMYYSEDMERCVKEAGLKIEAFYDRLGFGHSIMQCSPA
jgi:ubiquinone/menaquinone biosynthesis C-methylase UbiE